MRKLDTNPIVKKSTLQNGLETLPKFQIDRKIGLLGHVEVNAEAPAKRQVEPSFDKPPEPRDNSNELTILVNDLQTLQTLRKLQTTRH